MFFILPISDFWLKSLIHLTFKVITYKRTYFWHFVHCFRYLLLFSRSAESDSLWPMDCNTPGFPILHYFSEFAQTHVHWVSDVIQPPQPLSPLLPLPSWFGLVIQLCPTLETPWTVAHKAPLSMGFSRQEYWRGLPCPPPGDLPNPGIEPRSPALQVDSLPTELPGKRNCQISFYNGSWQYHLHFSV